VERLQQEGDVSASTAATVTAQDGMMQQAVCFDVGNGMPCLKKVVGEVVKCGAFTLAHLPNALAGPGTYWME
jgi:hypothetical protein